MPGDFQAIQESLRELEQRVLNVHAKSGGMAEWHPLEAIASAIRNFAEMLPVYGSFVEFLETALDADEVSRT